MIEFLTHVELSIFEWAIKAAVTAIVGWFLWDRWKRKHDEKEKLTAWVCANCAHFKMFWKCRINGTEEPVDTGVYDMFRFFGDSLVFQEEMRKRIVTYSRNAKIYSFLPNSHEVSKTPLCFPCFLWLASFNDVYKQNAITWSDEKCEMIGGDVSTLYAFATQAAEHVAILNTLELVNLNSTMARIEIKSLLLDPDLAQKLSEQQRATLQSEIRADKQHYASIEKRIHHVLESLNP